MPAVRALRAGGVVAYPTEAVFGLGCNPRDEAAVQRVLDAKHRRVDKGLILVAADLDQLRPYLSPLDPTQTAILRDTWPGPVTWLVPAAEECPAWLRGRHSSVAVRVSAHPVVRELCRRFGGPIVSTSANRSGREPARDARSVRRAFGPVVDAIVNAPVGGAQRPSEIRDLVSGAILRPG